MHNRRKFWDGKERRSPYTGEERRSGEDRRREFDQNVYGKLSVCDQFKDVGVFKVNPRIFAEEDGFLEPAWIYDRRDKEYQTWREKNLRHLIKVALLEGKDGEKMSETFHKWDSRDLFEGMYIG